MKGALAMAGATVQALQSMIPISELPTVISRAG